MPRKALYLAISLLAFTGCASLDREPEPPAEPTETSDITPAPDAIDDQPVVERSFRPEELYLLLAGEIAAQRGQYDITLANYVEAAQQSGDVGVIRRALLIAESLNNPSAVRTLTNTWIEAAPYSQDARRAAAIQSLRDGDMEATLNELEQILNLGGDANFDSLAAMAPRLPADQQQELLRLFGELQERHPDNAEIRYSRALLQDLTGSPQQALDTLAPLLEQDPEFQPALVLQGELLDKTGRTDEALEHLQTSSRRYPDNRQLGTLYARMLVNEDELRAAQDEFARLVERFPEEHGLRLSWALVALENGDLDLAREELQQLNTLPQYHSQASYYLAQIAEEENDPERAIELYSQVSDGQLYYPALTRAAELKARDGDVESALGEIRSQRAANPDDINLWLAEVNLLQALDMHQQAAESASEGLQVEPGNQSLLYARSMSQESLGNINEALTDLATMVELQPENPTALNALGYVLTIHTDRLTEARGYIEKALALQPDNPAILDSMGWVLYRQGDHGGALDYLRQAYEIFPDPEIAAHYGEVLWHTGQQAQARVIWERALDDAPDHELLLNTLDRLGVDDL